MIAEETGVASVIDPLGGSWFIESLTDELEQQAEALFVDITRLGSDGSMLQGILAGIDSGWFVEHIANASFDLQRRADAGLRRTVGVNAYSDTDDPGLEIMRISHHVEVEQAARVSEVRNSRNSARCSSALAALRDAATTDQNLVPLILEAVRADATIGDVTDSLVAVWGRYREPSWA